MHVSIKVLIEFIKAHLFQKTTTTSNNKNKNKKTCRLLLTTSSDYLAHFILAKCFLVFNPILKV